MKQTTVIRSGGNIFADLKLPDADMHMLKARVVIFVAKRIEQLGLTQQAAAKCIGLSQPDVSNLLRGRFEVFSLWRLLGFVRALGSDIEIKVRRRRDHELHGEEGRLSLMDGLRAPPDRHSQAIRGAPCRPPPVICRAENLKIAPASRLALPSRLARSPIAST